jgi:hypothetical protein
MTDHPFDTDDWFVPIWSLIDGAIGYTFKIYGKRYYYESNGKEVRFVPGGKEPKHENSTVGN